MLLPVSLATLTNASHSSDLGPRNVSVVVGAAFVTLTAPPTSTKTSALTELRPNQRGSSRNSITLSPPLLVSNVSYRDFRFRFQNSSPKGPSPGFRLAGSAPTDETLFGSSRTSSTRHEHPCGPALFASFCTSGSAFRNTVSFTISGRSGTTRSTIDAGLRRWGIRGIETIYKVWNSPAIRAGLWRRAAATLQRGCPQRV